MPPSAPKPLALLALALLVVWLLVPAVMAMSPLAARAKLPVAAMSEPVTAMLLPLMRLVVLPDRVEPSYRSVLLELLALLDLLDKNPLELLALEEFCVWVVVIPAMVMGPPAIRLSWPALAVVTPVVTPVFAPVFTPVLGAACA